MKARSTNSERAARICRVNTRRSVAPSRQAKSPRLMPALSQRDDRTRKEPRPYQQGEQTGDMATRRHGDTAKRENPHSGLWTPDSGLWTLDFGLRIDHLAG